ncbi:O-antigen ligase family protein [Microbacterium sp. DT81.1]|uniref:O-antigen ligase family protein n=1 Tax=Microbacterium sp. DT81.1 TaxID=3393413 RepID=UPI003CE94754
MTGDAYRNPSGRHPAVRRIMDLLRSPQFARAFTLTAFGAAFSAFALMRTAGRVATITIVVGLCILAAATLVARRRELSALRFLPTSLAAFVLWALASTIWSTDAVRTLGGWVALVGFGFLAVTIAHVRDTLQTVRALGDVLRALLGASLALEILSGLLLDMPITFLGIQGNIALGGPVQGIFGTRNLLGLVTVLALITFVIEWRTQSVGPGLAFFSVILAGTLAILSSSPTVLVLAVAVAAASGALMLVRHTAPEGRSFVQWALGAVVVTGLAIGYVARHPIIAWLGAGSDFSTRATLWNRILDYVASQPMQGWGWFGPWTSMDYPFFAINYDLRDTHQSALNALFDLILQVGWVGLLLFAAMAGIALVRSWLVASERRSVLYAWTPLILIALLVDSMFESFTLSGFGWMMLALCVVMAGQSRSWRETMDAADDTLPPAWSGEALPPLQG